MALSAKLAMRQGQTMVLTPQLLQAIKLLQMPSGELSAFIESELERNPILERAEERHEPEAPPEPVVDATPGRLGVRDDAGGNRRPRPRSRHRSRQRLRLRPHRPGRRYEPEGRRPQPHSRTMVGRWRRRRRRGRRPRGLCRQPGEFFGILDPAGDGGAARSRRSHDRRRVDRWPRRGRLFPRRTRGARRG